MPVPYGTVRYRYVPFNDGADPQALLLELAHKAVAGGRRSRPLRLDSAGGVAKGERATQVSLWVQRWQRRLSAWLHLRLQLPKVAAGVTSSRLPDGSYTFFFLMYLFWFCNLKYNYRFTY